MIVAQLETNKTMLVSKFDCLSREVKSLTRDLANIETYKQDRQEARHHYHELKSNFMKLYTEMSLKENHIVTIENFVEKYLPMRVMSQLQEVMCKVWSDDPGCDELKKLKALENITSKRFTKELLKDEGKPDLMNLITTM
jgi:hypothetical protein